MDEVPGGPRAGGERARRWWLSKLLWKPETQEALLPPVGSTVGGYHLEEVRLAPLGLRAPPPRGGGVDDLPATLWPRGE